MSGYLAMANGFSQHPKIMDLHDRAFRFHMAALDYCLRNATDGYLSARGARVVAASIGGRARRWVNELCDAELWAIEGEGLRLTDESFRLCYAADRIKRHNRDEVWRRFKGVCYLCGEKVSAGSFHIEHVVPLARGGSDTDDNLNIAHARCNVRKGSRLLSELDWYTA